MLCLQPAGPVPTAIEWYNPQGQLVSTDGGDEVYQAGGGGRAAFLNFRSYQHSQGGKYECRVTGPGDNLEKLSVCIGEWYTFGGCRLCVRQCRTILIGDAYCNVVTLLHWLCDLSQSIRGSGKYMNGVGEGGGGG